MSQVLSALLASIDAGLGGVLLANMVEAWLVWQPRWFDKRGDNQ
jgi:hypothetical protein